MCQVTRGPLAIGHLHSTAAIKLEKHLGVTMFETFACVRHFVCRAWSCNGQAHALTCKPILSLKFKLGYRAVSNSMP